ncbi:hypothetical protein BKA80DRAFT_264020 [Phyllosticta citrichinensis]
MGLRNEMGACLAFEGRFRLDRLFCYRICRVADLLLRTPGLFFGFLHAAHLLVFRDLGILILRPWPIWSIEGIVGNRSGGVVRVFLRRRIRCVFAHGCVCVCVWLQSAAGASCVLQVLDAKTNVDGAATQAVQDKPLRRMGWMRSLCITCAPCSRSSQRATVGQWETRLG